MEWEENNSFVTMKKILKGLTAPLLPCTNLITCVAKLVRRCLSKRHTMSNIVSLTARNALHLCRHQPYVVPLVRGMFEQIIRPFR